jgi:hypothetical protein
MADFDPILAGQVCQMPEGFVVTPDYCTSLQEPLPAFLCPMEANTYNIQFTGFKVRGISEEGQKVYCSIGNFEKGMEECTVEFRDGCPRWIRYHFGPELLHWPSIGASLEFTNGDEPLQDFRMIERHYYHDQLIVSYDFNMPFVIPGTTNTWEMIYTPPILTDEWRAALAAAPWAVKSDSFYFVNGKLVMHNRAEYNYAA